MLNGKKTYLVVLGIIAAAVGQWLTGDYTMQEAINQILVGLGIGGLRHGVAKGG